MTEIQGKSILVRVSARFELARVRVIGSRLYILKYMTFLDFSDQKVMNTFHDLCIHMMNIEVSQSVNFKISSLDI